MTAPEIGDDDPDRRIIDNIGSDSGFLAFVDVSNADLLFLGPAFVVATFLLELVVIATGRFFVGVGVGLVVFGVAVLYVFVCPDHWTPFGLLRSFITYHWRDSTMIFTDTATSMATPSGTVSPADVRELTRVRAVEQTVDAIRRADETLIGGVCIEPANLTLADDDRWDRAARGFGEVLNTLDYPVQIHSSAHRVDPDRMTAAYDDRRADPDVQSTPALRTIVSVYRRRRPEEFRERGTSIRRYHAIIPVDLQAVSLANHPWVRRLQSAPMVGDRLASLLADCLMYRNHGETVRERQRAILKERRDNLREQLSTVDGVTVRSVTATDLAELVEEYWSGRRSEYSNDGPYLRTTPVVMADQDAAQNHSATDASTDAPLEGTQ